jgi:hypothetical protein
MLETFIGATLGAFLGGIITYGILKNTLKTEKILTIIDEILNEIQDNNEFQRKIYMLGGLLGNGIKSGIGLSTPRGGKFKWEDLAAALFSQFFAKKGEEKGETPPWLKLQQ